MSYSFKNNKQIQIIKEMQKTGETYEINGIDLGRAYFFYRKFQEAFQTIPVGSYEIINQANNVFLKINDTALLEDAVEFQVCYVFQSESSQYIDPFPDLSTMQTKYNDLQKDYANLIRVLNSSNIFGDTLKMFYVLPQLEENEVWVRTKDGFKGFDIGSLEQNIKDFWEELTRITNEVINNIRNEGNKQIGNLGDYGEAVKVDISEFIENYIINRFPPDSFLFANNQEVAAAFDDNSSTGLECDHVESSEEDINGMFTGGANGN